MPPIVLLDVRPPGVSANADGFVRRHPDTIYLISSTPACRDAQCGDRTSLEVASIIMHEAVFARGTERSHSDAASHPPNARRVFHV